MSKSPFWGIGFRSFFLFGSLISALLVTYWAIAFFYGNLPSGYFDSILWHGHEMVYGFALAIVAGFLLTASANWTNTAPVSGTKLKIVFSFWLAGRLAFALSVFELPIPKVCYFLIDMLFIPALMLALAAPLIKARKFKNLAFLVLLFFLSIGNLLMHLAALEVIDFVFATKGIYLGVHLILLIMVIIGGRIIPFFTGNAIHGANIRKFDFLDKAAILSVLLYIVCDYFEQDVGYSAWIALLAFLLNFVRLLSWKPWITKSIPLLWILHLGYFWIVIGFFLVGISDVTALLPRSVAIHAFTAGAMGTFIIGMMSRVSLGHTGRPLKLAKGFVISYVLITLSAVIRVWSGFYPEYYSEGILVSGISWALSFLMFLGYYLMILITLRPDGRAG